MKNFVANNMNITLAQAQIPDDYVIGGSLNNAFQSEHVPFTWAIHAINQNKQISIFAISEEKFMDYRNAMLKQSINLIPNAIKSSFRAFEEPEDYLKRFAQSIFGSNLEDVAFGESVSLYNKYLQNSYNNLSNLANTVANIETQNGYQCDVNNLTCQSYLIKYEGVKDNQKYVVFAAMDFEGFEMKYQLNQTMNIFGGLFAGNTSQTTSSNSNVLGHGNCDICEWGSKMRYLMIAPEERENEALNDFVNFLATLQMDVNLSQQFDNMIMQRIYQGQMQTAQYQAQTRANIQNNIYQQQKLNNMLRQNSQSISAGIMDSWDKKMVSQSRMSTNYSEAIRGVNTYQTSDGRNVEVGVSADHVYENKYGDVYGVSGNEVDNELLNKLNWTKINKKYEK